MSSLSPAVSGSLLGHRPLVFYVVSRGLAECACQMAVVAVGWQIYALTGSAFDLGVVGLVQFAPTALLTFVAGHAADRYDRRRIVGICLIVEGLMAAGLAWGGFAGWLTTPEIYAAVLVFGAATAFESPAAAAVLPAVAPDGAVQTATALATGTMQAAMVSGPALGGLAQAISSGAPYAVMAVFWLAAALLNGAMKLERSAIAEERPTLRAAFAGVRFVRDHPAILGTISLDLFAVLLGGATALLPIYARDILHVGPWGLGALRCAPAVGALLATIALAHHPINRRVGMRMFQSVIAFGLATTAFALSPWVGVSLIALVVMGAVDAVSMVIRISLVQLATPDDMRGRVGAVNFLFVNASSQLGEFESGVMAALVGAAPAALLGGIATVAVALLWMKGFPDLRNVDRLE